MNYIVNFVEYKQQAFPLHKHEHYEILVYIDGEGAIKIEEQTFSIKKGTIVVVPPKMVHGSTSKNNLKSIYVAWKESAPFTFNKPLIFNDNQGEEGQFLVKAIYNNLYKNTEYLTALCNALAQLVLQNVKNQTKLEKAIYQIINNITLNFQDCDFNLNQVLNSVNYTEDYIREQFRLLTGKTPVNFLTDVRISFAEQLIELYSKELSLSEVALRSGYYDYVYFSRRFRQKTGISPQEYKQSVSKRIEQND